MRFICSRLVNLERLECESTPFGDDSTCFKLMGENLAKLKYLDLLECSLCDDSLVHLVKLKNIQILKLKANYRLTIGGVKRAFVDVARVEKWGRSLRELSIEFDLLSLKEGVFDENEEPEDHPDSKINFCLKIFLFF